MRFGVLDGAFMSPASTASWVCVAMVAPTRSTNNRKMSLFAFRMVMRDLPSADFAFRRDAAPRGLTS